MSELMPYSVYKNSGIEWIGEIPKGWKTRKLKYVLESLNYKRIPLSSEARSKMKKNYDYYGASGIIDKVEDYIFDETLILIGEDGANLYSRSSPLAFLATGKYWVNNHAHILRPRNGNIRYFVNLLETIDYTHYISGSAQPKLTQDALSNITLLEPPLKEQNSIGLFVKRKGLELDSLISKKKHLIKLLEEKRQAIITETVTKGLDPNVKMKDSGIEWIGDIPEHWERTKISRLFNEIGSGTTPKSSNELYYNGNIPWVNTGDLNDGYIEQVKNRLTRLALREYPTLKFYDKDSLVIAMYGATIGKLGILREKSVVNQACCVISKSESCNTKFIYYWLLANKEHIINLSVGGGQPNISQSIIRNIQICLPLNFMEQTKIVIYLEEKISSTNKVISKIKHQISKLREYRESLIYEAVTGKIDLRGYDLNEDIPVYNQYVEVAESNESY